MERGRVDPADGAEVLGRVRPGDLERAGGRAAQGPDQDFGVQIAALVWRVLGGGDLADEAVEVTTDGAGGVGEGAERAACECLWHLGEELAGGSGGGLEGGLAVAVVYGVKREKRVGRGLDCGARLAVVGQVVRVPDHLLSHCKSETREQTAEEGICIVKLHLGITEQVVRTASESNNEQNRTEEKRRGRATHDDRWSRTKNRTDTDLAD